MNKYRVGRKVGRTIYKEDALIGVMDTPELAMDFVTAANLLEDLLADFHWIENNCDELQAAKDRSIAARQRLLSPMDGVYKRNLTAAETDQRTLTVHPIEES